MQSIYTAVQALRFHRNRWSSLFWSIRDQFSTVFLSVKCGRHAANSGTAIQSNCELPDKQHQNVLYPYTHVGSKSP